MRHLLHANIPTGQPVPGGYSDGRLVGVGDGRVRTADRHGHPGLHSTYIRWASLERFSPPFTFGGRMLVRGRLDVLRLPDQPDGVAGWDHGIVWHPVHHDNRNNMVLSIGRADQLAGALVGWSAEIDGRYGLRTGIATRVREAAPNPLDGRWHTWAIHCPRPGEFVVTWDGRQIAHVAEKTPVSHVGAAPVGFRLDGFDVELDGTYVDDHQEDTVKLYPYGYNGQLLALDQLNERQAWTKLHPEMRRRLLAMFNDAPASVALGIGGGWRSSALQEATFRQRYYVVPCPGQVSWNGQCWRKRDGVASAAPPGRSYHEETTPNGYALAADLISADGWRWMNANCHRYGLRHFANVNSEPWHVQPVEVPNSRSQYRPATHVLGTWALPGTPEPAPPPTLTPPPEVPVSLIGYFNDDPATWVVLNALGWRRLAKEEPGELVFVGLAQYGPDGKAVAFPATWRTKYPRVGS